MALKNRIRIARTNNLSQVTDSTQSLEDGQPFYDKNTKLLYIGQKGSNPQFTYNLTKQVTSPAQWDATVQLANEDTLKNWYNNTQLSNLTLTYAGHTGLIIITHKWNGSDGQTYSTNSSIVTDNNVVFTITQLGISFNYAMVSSGAQLENANSNIQIVLSNMSYIDNTATSNIVNDIKGHPEKSISAYNVIGQIAGNDIDNIFESNGVTVKNAAQSDTSLLSKSIEDVNNNIYKIWVGNNPPVTLDPDTIYFTY